MNIKRLCEIDFWRKHHANALGRPDNLHFQHCFTDLFDLTPSVYDGVAIVDIGCGPLGSLEWADKAKLRVGLDPLADKYLALGADNHKMSYIKGSAELVPFASNSFDIVSCFNALDHVDDPECALGEMSRICRPGGRILLIVETNHPPTATEPHTLAVPQILASVGKMAKVEKEIVLKLRNDGDIYASISDQRLETDLSAQGIACISLRA